MGSILSVGMSQSSMNSNKSARTSFEKFLVDQNDYDSDWPTTMAELSEEQANDTKMYERFAFWLTYSTDSLLRAWNQQGVRADGCSTDEATAQQTRQ